MREETLTYRDNYGTRIVYEESKDIWHVDYFVDGEGAMPQALRHRNSYPNMSLANSFAKEHHRYLESMSVSPTHHITRGEITTQRVKRSDHDNYLERLGA